jgi:glycosyltransferase involved in cell wall biosynthesis
LNNQIVYQFAPQICRYDAIGNEIFALHRLMTDSGIESRAVCDFADAGLPDKVERWSKKLAATSRLTIVHYSHGSKSHRRVFASPEPKALFYHNITPAHYFRSTHPNFVEASEKAREQLSTLPELVDVAIAHSQFSAEELKRCGFRNVAVLPYVSLENLYQLEPDPSILSRFGGDGWVNLICVAQLSPHKCIEDCILVFDYFRRFVNRKSRLFIIGGWVGMEAYVARLQRLVTALNLTDVVFTGQVGQESLLAYYKIAGALISMSEHEGFCVPLIEAMRFDVPVFAFAATAVPETVQESGVLFRRKDWPTIAEAIGIVLEDSEIRSRILDRQRESLQHYSVPSCREKLKVLLATMGVGPQ